MMQLHIQLLGGFSARRVDGSPLVLPTRKTEALLVRLAATLGESVSRSELVKLLWGDRSREQAQGSVRQAFAAVRRALGPELAPALLVDRQKSALSPELVRTDSVEFERLSREGHTEADAAAVQLYSGDLLANFEVPGTAFEAWVSRERNRLRALAAEVFARHLSNVERRSGGRSVDVFALAERLLKIDPLHEAAHRALMRYHAMRGEAGLALARYESAQKARNSVGRAVEPETERLRRALGIGLEASPLALSARPTDKPSLAIIPIRGIHDPFDTTLTEGLACELASALARISWLFVVDAESSLVLGQSSAKPEDAARHLGVRYLLRVGVQHDQSRLRGMAILVDSDTGRHLFSERVDGSLASMLAWEDEATLRIAGTIGPTLEMAELARLKTQRSDNLDAWQCFLRAAAHLRTMTAVDAEATLSFAARALALDPDYAAAAGLSAWCRTIRIAQQWTADAATEAGLARLEGRRAVNYGADDPFALAMGGYALAFADHDILGGLAALERALTIDANSARNHAFAGWLRAYLGEHDAAIDHFELALKLSPIDAFTFRSLAGLGFARLFRGEREAAVASARRALALKPSFSVAHRPLIAALGLLDRATDAREAVANFLAVVPGISIDYVIRETRFVRPSDRALLEEGLRRAGVPQH